MIRLYFTRFSGGGELLPLLSRQRAEKVNGIRAEQARRQAVFSYVLLRYALLTGYGISAAPEFSYGEYGKPFLKEFPDIFFSMSHAADAVLCAVSDEPVGADLQDIRRLKGNAARKFCTLGELERIAKAPDADREACRLWCVKESYGKLTGKGFSEGFSGIDAEKLSESGKTALTEREGFFIAVSAWKAFEMPRVTEVSEAELRSAFGNG